MALNLNKSSSDENKLGSTSVGKGLNLSKSQASQSKGTPDANKVQTDSVGKGLNLTKKDSEHPVAAKTNKEPAQGLAPKNSDTEQGQKEVTATLTSKKKESNVVDSSNNPDENVGNSNNAPSRKSILGKDTLRDSNTDSSSTGSNKSPVLWISLAVVVIALIWWQISTSDNTSKTENQLTSAGSSGEAAVPMESAPTEADLAANATGSNSPTDSSNAIPGNASNAGPATITETAPNAVGATASPAPATNPEVQPGTSIAQFANGGTYARNVDGSLLEKIVKYIKENPQGMVILTGYASSDGDLTTNQRLSLRRAQSMKRQLVANGINANRVEAIGGGVDNPVADNSTEEGRSKNRRVEVSYR